MREFLRSYWTPAGKRAAWNLAWTLVFLGWSNLCSVGITFLLTRGLSQETYGLLAYLLTLQTFVLVVGAGTRPVLVREGTRRPDLLDALATSHFVIGLTVAIIGGAIGLVYVVGQDAAAAPVAAVLLAGNVLFCMQMPPFFDVHHRQAAAGFCVAVADSVALGLAYALWRTERLDLAWAGGCYALRWGLSTLLQIAFYHRRVRPLRFAFDGALTRELVRSSWPLTVTFLLGAGGAFAVMDLLVRGGGQAAAALYAIGVQISTVAGQLGVLAVRIVQPYVAGEHGMMRSFLVKLGVFFGGFLIASSVAVAMLGWVFIHFLLPQGYADGKVAMFVLVAAAAAGSVWQLIEAYLVARGRPLGSPVSVGLGVAVTIGLLLVNEPSALRAAVANLVGVLVMVVVAGGWLFPRGKLATPASEHAAQEADGVGDVLQGEQIQRQQG